MFCKFPSKQKKHAMYACIVWRTISETTQEMPISRSKALPTTQSKGLSGELKPEQKKTTNKPTMGPATDIDGQVQTI